MSIPIPIRTSLPLPPQQTIHALKPRPTSPKFGSGYGLPSPKMQSHPPMLSGSSAGSISSQNKDKSDLIDQIINNCNYKKSQSPRNIGKRMVGQQTQSKNGSLKTQPVEERGKQNYPNLGSPSSFDRTPYNPKYRAVEQVYRASLQPQLHPVVRDKPGIFMKPQRLTTQQSMHSKASPRIFKATANSNSNLNPTTSPNRVLDTGLNMEMLSPSRLPRNRPNSKDKDINENSNNIHNHINTKSNHTLRIDQISNINNGHDNQDRQIKSQKQKQKQKYKQKQLQLLDRIQQQRSAHLQHCKREQRKLRLYYVQLQNKLCEMRNKQLRALAQYQSTTLKQYDTCMKIITNSNQTTNINKEQTSNRVEQCKHKIQQISQYPQLRVSQSGVSEIKACLVTHISGVYFSFDQSQLAGFNGETANDGKMYDNH